MAVIRDVSVRNGCLLSHIDLFRQQFRQYGFTHITLYIGLSLNTVTYIVCQILSSLAIRRFSGFLPVFSRAISTRVQPQQDLWIPSGGWHWWIGKVKGERKRLNLPWFTQKANKAPDMELALFTETAGALSVGWGCRTPSPQWRRRVPSRSGLRSPGKTQRAPVFQVVTLKEAQREKKREKEKKNDTGRLSFGEQGP